MTKSNWITPSQALEIMQSKLPNLEPGALAIWGREKRLRARAEEVWVGDGIGGSKFEKPPCTDWWQSFWEEVNEESPAVHKNKVNWTIGEINTITIYEGIYEEINVRGLQFNRPDLIRCIRAARGEREPAKKADKHAVELWVEKYIEEHGLNQCTSRAVEDAAKRTFFGQRGVIVAVRHYLRQKRTNQ